MTFREKMESDFKAILENEPRLMPNDWAPDFHVEGDKCIAHARAREVADISLGFELTDDHTVNGQRLIGLFRSVWGALELARLGRTDELKSMGIMT